VHSTPRFVQGVFAFQGKGLDQPAPVDGLAGTVVIDLGLVEV
jgi:assimilatory nitrate reductase catalytic subunit